VTGAKDRSSITLGVQRLYPTLFKYKKAAAH